MEYSIKIGVVNFAGTYCSPKVYTKNVSNIGEYNVIPAPIRTLSFKQVIVVLYY